MNGALIVINAPAVDADPNTTQPPDTRISVLPLSSSGNSTLWVAAVGGAPTLELWFQPLGDTVTPPLWIKVTTAAALTPAARAAVMLPLGGVPVGCPFFLRVVVVGGATQVLAGLTRA